jgi:4-hydroxy-4-methyl-2-oxoglutarate aldolase
MSHDEAGRESAPDLAAVRDTLFTAVLSDCLDSVGLRCQALPARIRPLDEASVLCGRARTASFVETHAVPDGVNPYALEIALVDDLKPGDVPVFACANSLDVAPWGELLSTAAQVRGSAGALMDGCVRDVKAIRAMGYPVFHGGIGPLDTKGRARIVEIDRPVLCAGVPVATGDLVFGDADGVVVVPRAAEAEVLRLAFEKVRGERATLADLRRGDTLATVFARYGIL